MQIHPTSFLLGLGAALVVPLFTRVLRPLAVEAAVAGMGMIEEGRRLAAEQMETFEDIVAEARRVLDAVGLLQLANRPVSDVAYGERRRVELAVALANPMNAILNGRPPHACLVISDRAGAWAEGSLRIQQASDSITFGRGALNGSDGSYRVAGSHRAGRCRRSRKC